MRGYPGGRGSRAERLLPPCPDPSPGVSGSVPSLGPPLAAQAAVLHWLFLHITEAGAHSWLKPKADTLILQRLVHFCLESH